MTYTETDVVAAIEGLAARPVTALTQAERDQIDQFHAGGAEAVDRIRPSLRLAPGMTVLDVGSGFGGPARQIAGSTGAEVVGVDITTAYVEAARELTEAAGLADQVRFVCSDIAALEPTGFDAAYTMHVQMNVADKAAFFAEIGHRLRPGARLATFEVCRTGDSDPALPLPWSLDGTDSHLVGADELCRTIASAGFELVEWVDETAWVREWFQQVAARLAAAPARPAAVLPALLQDGPVRMMNFAAAVMGGVVSIQRGCFIRGR